MEKSAAYLLGFQQGLGEDVELEKAAEFLHLLDFVPENEKQAAALVKGLQKLRALIAKLSGKSLEIRPGRPAASAQLPASLRVAGRGQTAGEIKGTGGIPGRRSGGPTEGQQRGGRSTKEWQPPKR